MISCPPPTIECPRSLNYSGGGSASNTAMNCIAVFLNWVQRSQSLQYVLEYYITNMHAVSDWSDIFAFSSRVNIQKPAFSLTIRLLSPDSRVESPSILILTAMLDWMFLNTVWLEVIISSKNECGFNRDLSDLISKIIFYVLWASMNVCSQRPITWDDSKDACSWHCYLHCGIEETCSTGIICIVSDQVLHRPLEHGTSSMGKHLRAKACITMLNELTELEVTELSSLMVAEIALAILKRQASRGITIVSSQWKFIFHI